MPCPFFCAIVVMYTECVQTFRYRHTARFCQQGGFFMRTFFNFFLCVLFLICILLLCFQGFAFPALSYLSRLLLRCLAASSFQWLICRTALRSFPKIIPLLICGILCIWGFFLYLTSPSWQNATFSGFLQDYVSPTISCALVYVMWLRFHR